MIDKLIDKFDSFEIVRAKIHQILTEESINQMLLAIQDQQDPVLWQLNVYQERSNPWEQYLNPKDDGFDSAPIVNIWYQSTNFEKNGSDLISSQVGVGIFNIDIYGYGQSSDNQAGGHHAGDKAAAVECQRALRLVRNIIMAGIYRNLELPPQIARDRWPQSITIFQPMQEKRAIQGVVAARIALEVKFNETSLQQDEEILELISVEVNRAADGVLYFTADYPASP